MNKPSGKTERIIKIYGLFSEFSEVSMQEIAYLFPDFSIKTFQRDISLLKNTGVQIWFSCPRKNNTQGSYILKSRKHDTPKHPEGTAERRQFEKLLRLIKIIDSMGGEPDPAKWYCKTFPKVSKRTMQRDFAILNRIGYSIRYRRERDLFDEDLPIRVYYCHDWPN